MALSAGFQLHLVKPIEPDSLLKSIATALGREPLVTNDRILATLKGARVSVIKLS
jgi:hypothetical protein